jgi:hypothetical protein
MQAGERGKPLLCFGGQADDLRMIIHEHVPVDGALAWSWLRSTPQPACSLI